MAKRKTKSEVEAEGFDEQELIEQGVDPQEIADQSEPEVEQPKEEPKQSIGEIKKEEPKQSIGEIKKEEVVWLCKKYCKLEVEEGKTQRFAKNSVIPSHLVTQKMIKDGFVFKKAWK